MLSLISLPIGMLIAERKKYTITFGGNRLTYRTFNDWHYLFYLKKISYYFYWATIFASIYVAFDKILYVQNNGYLAYYLSYSGVGTLAYRIQTLNDCSYFLYLATMPSKKESSYVINSWLFINLLTILAGGRSSAVTAVIFVVLYYYIRENYGTNLPLLGQKEEWITDKLKLFIILLLPFSITFLGFWNYARSGMTENTAFWKYFFTFFEDQGTSINLIPLMYEHQNGFPQHYYSFGPIINFFRNNVIARLLTGYVMPAQQTEAMALSGYNFGQTITYLVMPWNYFKGIGLGSCYLAELWLDFNYVGVVVYNVVLGGILSSIHTIKKYSPIKMFLFLYIFSSLMLLPRSGALDWIASVLNYTVIISVVLMTGIAKTLYKKNATNNADSDRNSKL